MWPPWDFEVIMLRDTVVDGTPTLRQVDPRHGRGWNPDPTAGCPATRSGMEPRPYGRLSCDNLYILNDVFMFTVFEPLMEPNKPRLIP